MFCFEAVNLFQRVFFARNFRQVSPKPSNLRDLQCLFFGSFPSQKSGRKVECAYCSRKSDEFREAKGDRHSGVSATCWRCRFSGRIARQTAFASATYLRHRVQHFSSNLRAAFIVCGGFLWCVVGNFGIFIPDRQSQVTADGDGAVLVGMRTRHYSTVIRRRIRSVIEDLGKANQWRFHVRKRDGIVRI